ncbi:MAG: hypothetical protein GYA02_17520 [Clostridiaceae bacterium]|nr:hypothetical protein [Clostridiaceae bacterium]
MRKYDGLRKEIAKLKASAIGVVSPYLAWLNSISDGYELSISFWDGKPNSQRKMPKTLLYKFKTSEEAEAYLLKYLQDNRPYKPFVLFSNEELIYE